jgi:tRNA(Ile)-lysidine synthase
MLSKLNHFIKQYNLLSFEENVLVAVSGGQDSVVLFDLLFKAGYKVAIVHCNFKLRGAESDEDEEFVRKLANDYNVNVFVKDCDAAKYALDSKLSIQEAARELRYDFFKELMKFNKFNKVAVAHHADDDLETFFINFYRGSGINGLKGIPVKRNNIVRPILFASKKLIEEYALINKLTWRNDSSNFSDKYLRNKIRHNLLPLFTEIAPDKNAIYKTIDFLKEDSLMFDALVTDLKDRISIKKDDLVIIDIGKSKLPLPSDIIIYYMLKEYGFTGNDAKTIDKLLKDKKSGKVIYSDKYELLVDRDKLIVRIIRTPVKNISYKVTENMTFLSEPFKATIQKIKSSAITSSELKNNNNAYVDFDKLVFPLIIRKWRRNDRFKPYGMKGSKLVSDFLNDLKLNKYQKEEIWLLESENHIVWIIGYRISDIFKITDLTKYALKISLL